MRICMLLCSLWLAVAQAAPVLIHNVRGHTPLADGWKRFDALLFDRGRVLATGSRAELAHRAPEWNHLDGRGAVLLPGLIDAHGHLLLLGLNLNRVDLRQARSLAEALETVRRFAAEHPRQRWLLGRGWNQVLWRDNGRRFPSRRQLDEAVPDRPVWLRRIDGHAGWANSRALELAGITAATLDPPGGRILREADGTPTGILVDNAMQLLERVIPEISPEEHSAALEAAIAHLHALGITGMHDAGTDAPTLNWLLQRQAQGRLDLRIYAMLSGDDPQLEAMLAAGPVDTPMLRVRSVKLYADGALGSRGAWLLQPYADQPDSTGLALMPPDRLRRQVERLAGQGWQVNVHAIGDAANRLVLDIFSRLPRPASAGVLRHRIEHAQILHPDDIPRFAKLGVIASMQPTHATSDMNMAPDRLGGERLVGAYAWRKLLDSGARIAAGSDFPVELANPFHGLYAAVTRKRRDGQPEGGWLPQERMRMREALRAFTLDAAFAAFAENELGSLEPGRQADFILVDTDPFTADPEAVLQTRVLQTWVAGRQVYARRH